MPTAAEAATAANGQAAVNQAGVATISENQTITFTAYQRVVLPLDGSAFWVKADLLSPSMVYNGGGAFGSDVAFNQGPGIVTPAATATVSGSLHYTTTNNQDMDEGFSVNRIIFTATSEIELLNTVDPKVIFIGTWDGMLFAFSKRTMLYRQAGVFHYQGDAVYPALASQMISFPRQLDTRQIVSNSLPFWLTLNQFCPMFPSYLVSEDITPPWCAVHIEPSQTQTLQAAPYIDQTNQPWQLTRDHVKLTFYGLRNFNALGFQVYMNAYMLSTGNMGLMTSPTIRDEKRTQAELNILAQKKTMEFDVSYYQTTAVNVARQLITECIPTFIPTEYAA